jgi:Tfp pilus assembly protein PilE
MLDIIPSIKEVCLVNEYRTAFERLITLNTNYHLTANKTSRKRISREMELAGRQLVQITEILSKQNRFYTAEAMKIRELTREPTCSDLFNHYTGKDLVEEGERLTKEQEEKTGAFKFRVKWLLIKKEVNKKENRGLAERFFMKKTTFVERLVAYIRNSGLENYWTNHPNDLNI